MKKAKIVSLGAIITIAGVLIAGNCVAAAYAPMITTFLAGTGVNFDSDEFTEAAAKSDELAQRIAEEGIVMLKNNDSVLPLATKKVNVFGWAATDQGFLLSGIGSGSSTISDSKKVTFLQALRDDGFEYNQQLIDMYNAYDSTDYGYNSSRMKLIEPDQSYYTNALIENARDFSDTAVVVLSRIAGENVGSEIPTYQTKSHGQTTDNSRTYLEISTEEEALLDTVKENFAKVVVIVNSTNTMQLGFLNDYRIQACLDVGIPGQSGTLAIGRILDGTVNPSGHLTDTYAYDLTQEPSFSNYLRNGNNIQYLEDIYFGYKWYETADAEGYFAGIDNEYGKGYDGVVQYPFGYGLSYTDFEWTLTDATLPDGSELGADSHLELTFSCTNTGTVSGKDVLEVYYTAPYTSGGIEKSAINLVDFAKTGEIEPGKTQIDIKLSLDSYDMASYDCYDMNHNGSATYELDAGEYAIKFMSDAHTPKKMSSTSRSSLSYSIPSTLVLDKDPVTGEEVANRFTGDEAYSGVPLDGSTLYRNEADATPYLSRADFAGTFPTTAKAPTNTSDIARANNYVSSEFDQTEMPTTETDSGLYMKTKADGSQAGLNDLEGKGEATVFNDDLLYEIGADYDSPKLQQLVEQMTPAELAHVVEDSGFGTPAIASIGKPRTYDFDGPAGFNSNTQTGISSGEWTAFPNETLVGQTWSKFVAKQMGLSMGLEGQATSLSGWYAPGVNLHRSPFNARNYEYYSEDPVLSGYMAANVIEGAKANGLYAYLKHFTLSEPGINARNLNTWLTEQNFRENYLKPFEIAVKKGGANAIMTAFNSVGGSWAGASYAMNVEILRDEWGFRGSLITDWSTGDGNMNTNAGLKGGNDIWLNPNTGNSASKINRNDPTMIYCAQHAAKDVIYTYANTYQYAKHYDHSNDDLKAPIGENQITPPFAWWIPVLASIDAAVAIGLGIWLYFVLRKPRQKA